MVTEGSRCGADRLVLWIIVRQRMQDFPLAGGRQPLLLPGELGAIGKLIVAAGDLRVRCGSRPSYRIHIVRGK